MKKVVTVLSLICILFLQCNQSTESTEREPGSKVDLNIKSKVYENERFKEVTVQKVSENSFKIKGRAQVFEATLSYVVEDGHYELVKGFATTDAGAPEFGNFDFNIQVEKKEPNSTLMLILFESSPKDGSRTHELIIPLETNSM